jgi:peptide/nickel transport system permease protein
MTVVAISETALSTAEKVDTPLRLMLRKLGRHKLAQASMIVLVILYAIALFAEFVAPADPGAYAARYTYAPPQPLHLFDRDTDGSLILSPHVNGYDVVVDPEALKRTFVLDPEKKLPVRFFIETKPYDLFGVITMRHKLIGPVDQKAPFYLLGADRLGRDMLSRLVHGSRISLSIGLVGVMLSLIIGVVIGGISGYVGDAWTWPYSASSNLSGRFRRFRCGWASRQRCRDTGPRFRPTS